MRTLWSKPCPLTALTVLALLPLLSFGALGAFAQSGELGAYFTSVTNYQSGDESFKRGYAAGADDAVSLFTMVTRQLGHITNPVLGFYQCLNNQGDKLGQFKTWVDSAVARPSSDKDAIVVFIASACNFSTSDTPSNFEEMTQYSKANESFKLGFAAGVFDPTSALALTASRTGVNNQKTLAIFQCRDSPGDKLSQLEQWINTALAKGSPYDPAFVVMIRACLP